MNVFGSGQEVSGGKRIGYYQSMGKVGYVSVFCLWVGGLGQSLML